MKRSTLKTWLAVTLILFTIACSDDLTKNSAPAQNVLSPFKAPDGVTFNGDYLVIPTPQLYDQTMSALKASEPESVSAWTAGLGFTSMRDIYVRAMKEQGDYLATLQKEYESLPPDDKRLKTRPMIPQSSFVAKHAALFDLDEYGAITRLKLSNPVMDRLVNKDGIIMVAGHIFQYNEDNTKIIVGGDARKIALLPSVTATNEKLNIIVNPVTVQRKTWIETPADGRLVYSYSNRCDVSLPLNTTYYFNYSVSISTSLQPVYDYSNLICDPPGCGMARASEAQDCSCYYPIISQQGFTLHYATMECRKNWVGLIDSQHASLTNKIDATITDNVNGTLHYTYTNHNLVNATLYIYDGAIPAGYDITSGSYTFTETTYSEEMFNLSGNGYITGQVTHSW